MHFDVRGKSDALHLLHIRAIDTKTGKAKLSFFSLAGLIWKQNRFSIAIRTYGIPELILNLSLDRPGTVL